MKPSHKEYIDKFIGVKSAETIAKELGIRERNVIKYVKQIGLTKRPAQDRTKTEKTAETARPVKKWIHALCAVVIIAATALVYSNAVQNDFIWDDEFLVRDNTAIKDLGNALNIFKTYLAETSGNINNFYRPVQELSYMIDNFLWGYFPFGFHLTNIILHALCAVLLYVLCLKILKSWIPALITALLFGVHPINTEAVTYVAGRADPLFLLFFLISFILFISAVERSKDSSKAGYFPLAASIICYAVSILSKELGIILPVFLAAYIFIFLNRHERQRILGYLAPYAVVFAVYVILRSTVLDFSDTAPSSVMAKFNLYLRMLTTFKAICVYLVLLVLPLGLHMERRIKIAETFFTPEVFFAAASVFTIAVLMYFFYRNSRKAYFAGLWFFIGLIPVSNIVPINSFIAEHWLYLPAIGVFMLVGIAVDHAILRSDRNSAANFIKIVTILSLLAVTTAYGMLTYQRNKDWKDGITFFKSTLKHSPSNSRLHLNFGNVYTHMEMYDEAMQEYEAALKIRPDYAEAYSNIANIYIIRGDYQKAETYLKKALEFNPKLPAAVKMMRSLKGDIF